MLGQYVGISLVIQGLILVGIMLLAPKGLLKLATDLKL